MWLETQLSDSRDQWQVGEVTFFAAPGGDSDTDRGAAFNLWCKVFQKFGQDMITVLSDLFKLSRGRRGAEWLTEVRFGYDGVDRLLPRGVHGVTFVQVEVEAQVMGVRQPVEVLSAVANHLF